MFQVDVSRLCAFSCHKNRSRTKSNNTTARNHALSLFTMKLQDPFEINVAVIGYVSVGKTTLLNALLRDKYSEVSPRRATAGINKFRLFSKEQLKKLGEEECTESNWRFDADVKLAESTLTEISGDNKALRESSSDLLVKSFDVEVEEPFFEMRDDTCLVFIDIPGKNNASE